MATILTAVRDSVEREIVHLERMVSNASKVLRIVEHAISLFGATEYYTQQREVWSKREAVCSAVLNGAKANLDLLNAVINDGPFSDEEIAAVLQLTSVLADIRREAIEALE